MLGVETQLLVGELVAARLQVTLPYPTVHETGVLAIDGLHHQAVAGLEITKLPACRVVRRQREDYVTARVWSRKLVGAFHFSPRLTVFRIFDPEFLTADVNVTGRFNM